jgi:hypothetical protein
VSAPSESVKSVLIPDSQPVAYSGSRLIKPNQGNELPTPGRTLRSREIAKSDQIRPRRLFLVRGAGVIQKAA